MPWTAADADRHIKGLTDKQKRAWAHIANSALEKCQKDGGENCDAHAIRQANAAAKRIGESMEETEVTEAGKRHNVKDQGLIQKAHDHMVELGAACGAAETSPIPSSWLNWPYESQRPLTESAALRVDQSQDALRSAISNALRGAHKSDPENGDCFSCCGGTYPYVRDLFMGDVVYELSGKLYRRSYTVEMPADGPLKVTLGDPQQVSVAYVAVDAKAQESFAAFVEPNANAKEAAELSEPHAIELREEVSFQEGALIEAAKDAPASVRLKLIAPGWSKNNRYYPAEVLKRDGPKVFRAGLHCYWNHATDKEMKDRSEGDLNHLAAVLTENAQWSDIEKQGPGLYANSKVFSDYANQVKEKGPHIGVSIYAYGTAAKGEAEGRKGDVLESFTDARSTDFVTLPAAGGLVLQESATAADSTTTAAARESRQIKKEKPEMAEIDEKEIQALREANATSQAKADQLTSRIKTLETHLLLRDAEKFLMEGLVGEKLHPATKAKIASELILQAPINEDGTLDTSKLGKMLETAILTESTYLQKVSGNNGIVRHMGVSTPKGQTVEESEKILGGVLGEIHGLTEAGAAVAGRGRL